MTQLWPLKRVGLRVRDLSACIAYYEHLGLTLVRDERAEGCVGLGVDGQELLVLRHTPHARPRPRNTTGLYHFALLLPDEAALGTFLRHSLHDGGARIDGLSDHLVSQALYLNDPEGNGIEVYADRPREAWPVHQGLVTMDTFPLKTEPLLAKAGKFSGLPAGTILGHMHLSVNDLDRTTAYYEQTFGMQLQFTVHDQAGFISWDGYHHHLGINIWSGPNAARHEADVSGLDFFEVVRPDLAPGTYQDPDGITVIVTA